MNHRNLPNENVIGRPLGELFPGAVAENWESNASTVVSNRNNLNTNRNNNNRNNNSRNNNNNRRNNNNRGNNNNRNNRNNMNNRITNNINSTNTLIESILPENAPRVNRSDHGPYTDAVVGGPVLNPEFPFSPELDAAPLKNPRTPSNRRVSRRSRRKNRRSRRARKN